MNLARMNVAAVAFLIAAAGCSSPPTEAAATSRAAIGLLPAGTPELLWQNEVTGEMNLWLFSDGDTAGPTYTGSADIQQNLSGQAWNPFGTVGNDVLWWDSTFDSTEGDFSEWSIDNAGNVQTSILSSKCSVDTPTPCSAQPIGIVRFAGNGLAAGYDGVLFWDAGTIFWWTLNGTQVTGTVTVNQTCPYGGNPSGCAEQWHPFMTADINGDGSSDLLWRNESTGQLSVWLLNGSGTFLGSYIIPLACDATCARAGWAPVSAADTNGDGTADILWWNNQTNQFSIWYLSATGQVLAHPLLAWPQPTSNWRPVGYVTLQQSPK